MNQQLVFLYYTLVIICLIWSHGKERLFQISSTVFVQKDWGLMFTAWMAIRSFNVLKAIRMRVWINLVFITGNRYSVGIPSEVWHLATELELAWDDVLVLLDAVGTVCVLGIMVCVDEDVSHLRMTKRNVVLTEFLRMACFWERGPKVLVWSHDVVVTCLVEGFVTEISAIGDAAMGRFTCKLTTESSGKPSCCSHAGPVCQFLPLAILGIWWQCWRRGLFTFDVWLRSISLRHTTAEPCLLLLITWWQQLLYLDLCLRLPDAPSGRIKALLIVSLLVHLRASGLYRVPVFSEADNWALPAVDIMPRVWPIIFEFTADCLLCPLTSWYKGSNRFENVAAKRYTLLILFSFSFHCFKFVEMAIVNMSVSAVS